MKAEMMHIVKKDKKKLLILATLAVVAIALMLIGDGVSSKNDDAATDSNTSSSTDSSEDYFAAMEADLSATLAQIDGVGKVKVLISWDGDISENYAYNEESTEKTGEDGATEKSTKNEMVLVDGDSAPVVKEKIYPEITGVLVVAEGADNEEIRHELQTAVSAYLSVGTNRIEITAMEAE